MTDVTELESVEEFRLRARPWLAAYVPRRQQRHVPMRARRRSSQTSSARATCSVACSTVASPACASRRSAAGLGLTPEHQRALNEESDGYEMPDVLQVPTFVPCAAVLLEFGTEELKQRHIPRS